ncbi:MAG: 4-hydroxy-3-methylbut-2-enyl diphosphate reductase [Coriobacteriales bacterium]|jgi:4-hydroxy-3-methylbut-2-enyl diphosphate reductase
MGKPVIEVAENAGACYGVKRALKIAREAADAGDTAHTLGSLIHNPRVVKELAADGVGVADTLDEAESGTLVLRSHGTAPQVVAEARRRGFDVRDATCPYVSKVQHRARELGQAGYAVVIIGQPGHAEVEGIRAWGGDAVVAVADTADKLPDALPDKVGVVIQTTQSAERVAEVLSAVRERAGEVRVEETVCNATQERQAAARELAGRVDVMIVVGGHNSGNTTRLVEICAPLCPAVHHIEGPEELKVSWLAGAERIGVTAGASTPQEQIDDVCAALAALSGSREA